MLTSLSKRCISILAMACVLTLAFFPLAHGPFQATNGPTTAFRAKRAFFVLLLSIVAAALRVIKTTVSPLFVTADRSWGQHCLFLQDQDRFPNAAVLRC